MNVRRFPLKSGTERAVLDRRQHRRNFSFEAAGEVLGKLRERPRRTTTTCRLLFTKKSGSAYALAQVRNLKPE
jgi:hypothetical protein